MLNRSRGFTIIECLIVIAILGILFSIFYPEYDKAKAKAAAAKLQENKPENDVIREDKQPTQEELLRARFALNYFGSFQGDMLMYMKDSVSHKEYVLWKTDMGVATIDVTPPPESPKSAEKTDR